MIEENRDEKILLFIKILVVIIEGIVIGTIAFIFFGVSKVNAQSQEVNMSAWSWGYSGTDSGAINNGSSTSVNWTTHSQLTTAYINAIFPGANGTSTINYSIATSNKKLCSLVNVYVWEGSSLLSTNPTWTCGQGSNIYFLFISLQLETKANYNYTIQVKFNSVGQIPTSYNLGSTSVTGTIRTELSDSLTNQTYIDGTNNIINNINNVASGIENAIISSNEYCQNYNFINGPIVISGYYLNNSGGQSVNANFGITDYIPLNNDKTYLLNRDWGNNTGANYCIYNTNKILISCTPFNTTTSFNITNANYIRISISTTTGRNTTFTGNYCQDRTEATNQELKVLQEKIMHQSEWEEEDDEEKNGLLRNIISSIGNIFSFLQDDDVDDPENALDDINDDLISDTPISSLLLLPVSIYQKVINNINGTCNSLNLGELWEHDLVMTCINIDDIIGSTLYGVIDVIISGFFILAIRKKIIDIFNNLTSLKTRRNELE